MATEVTVWQSDNGKTFPTEATARREDLIYALELACTHPTKAREVAEQIVTDFHAFRNVIKDRSHV